MCFNSELLRVRLVHVFKNWKLLFENICGNTCGWKSVLKCVKCCLKTENGCLKTQTKHLLTKKYLTLKHFKFILKRCTNFQYILDVGHCQDNWFFSYLSKTLSSFLVFSSVLIFQLLDTKNLNSNSLKNDFELNLLTQQYFTLTHFKFFFFWETN